MGISYVVAGSLIALVGLLLLLLAAPLFKFADRNHYSLAQFEAPVITWSGRLLGLVLVILGMVTVLQ